MNPLTPSSTLLAFTPKRRALTAIDFCAWMEQAAPGEQLHYHHGFLVLDKFSLSDRLCERRRTDLVSLAACAFRAAENGLVHLVQQRLGPEHFAYIAVARPKPNNPSVSLSTLLSEEAA